MCGWPRKWVQASQWWTPFVFAAATVIGKNKVQWRSFQDCLTQQPTVRYLHGHEEVYPFGTNKTKSETWCSLATRHAWKAWQCDDGNKADKLEPNTTTANQSPTFCEIFEELMMLNISMRKSDAVHPKATSGENIPAVRWRQYLIIAPRLPVPRGVSEDGRETDGSFSAWLRPSPPLRLPHAEAQLEERNLGVVCCCCCDGADQFLSAAVIQFRPGEEKSAWATDRIVGRVYPSRCCLLW